MSEHASAPIWGLVGGAICALIVFLAALAGTEIAPNPLLANPTSAFVLGFFLGWAAAELRNWLARHR